MKIISSVEFEKALKNLAQTHQDQRFTLLVGAGFSVTTGIPLSNEIAGMLASMKLDLDDQKPFSDYASFIRDWQDQSRVWKTPIEELKKRWPIHQEKSPVQLYIDLFDDTQIFPGGPASRQLFISALLTQSVLGSYGYNFESLHLAEITEHFQEDKISIDTILTTNFDDVLPSAFDRLGITCRMIDDPVAVSRESHDTFCPRIIYLHGRHTHYDLLNTSQELLKPSEARLKAIKRAVNIAADRGGMIVSGYSGWEDSIMPVLKANLKKRKFPGGVYWCTRRTDNAIPSDLEALANRHTEITVVSDCSAMRLSKILLRTLNITPDAISKKFTRMSSAAAMDFGRRIIEVRGSEKPEKCTKPDGIVSALQRADAVRKLDPSLILENIVRAKSKSTHALVALEMLRNIEHSETEMNTKELAYFFHKRAELRIKHTTYIQGAISDELMALDLEHSDPTGSYLLLYQAYTRLGLIDAANDALVAARTSAERTKDYFDLGRCETIEAFNAYWHDELNLGVRLTDSAIRRFRKIDRPDWICRAIIRKANLLLYSNRLDAALRLANRALGEAKGNCLEAETAEAHFLKANIFSESRKLKESEKNLALAEGFAIRAPSFVMLGDIYRIRADLELSRGRVETALQMRDLSNTYLSWASHLPALAIGRIGRQITSSYLVESFGENEYSKFQLACEEYLRYSDISSVVVQYAELGVSLLRRASICDWKLLEKLINDCSSLSCRFAEESGIDLESEEALDRDNLKAMLACHVDEWPLLLRMFMRLKKSPNPNEECRRSLRRDYNRLKARVEFFDFASPGTVAWAAVLSSRLLRAKVLKSYELIRYDSMQGVTQFKKAEILSYLERMEMWELKALV